MSQREEWMVLSVCDRQSKGPVKGFVGGVNGEVGAENEQRITRRSQRGFGIIALLGQPLFTALQRIDVQQDDQDAVDFVVGGEIGPGAQQVPMAIVVTNFTLPDRGQVDNLGDEPL